MIKVKINGQEYDANIGLRYGSTLDESLDSGTLETHFFTSEDNIKPFSLVEIIDTDDNNKTIQMVVQIDNCKLEKRGNKNYYSHNLTLVEPVELLKFKVLCNKTFTSSFNIEEPKKMIRAGYNAHITLSNYDVPFFSKNNYLTYTKGAIITDIRFKVKFGVMFSETIAEGEHTTYSSDITEFNKTQKLGTIYGENDTLQRELHNKIITADKLDVADTFIDNDLELKLVIKRARNYAILYDYTFKIKNALSGKEYSYRDYDPSWQSINQILSGNDVIIYLECKGYMAILHHKVNEKYTAFGMTQPIENKGDYMKIPESAYNFLEYDGLRFQLTGYIQTKPMLMINGTTDLIINSSQKIFKEENWDSEYTLLDILKEIRQAYYEENKKYPYELDFFNSSSSLYKDYLAIYVNKTGSPELSFVQSTIYQAVADVFSYINAVPTLEYVNDKWELGFEFLEQEGNEITNEITNTESNLLNGTFVNSSVGCIRQSIAKNNQQVNYVGTSILPTCNNLGAIKQTDGAWGYDLGQPIYRIVKATIPNVSKTGGKPSGNTFYTGSKYSSVVNIIAGSSKPSVELRNSGGMLYSVMSPYRDLGNSWDEGGTRGSYLFKPLGQATFGFYINGYLETNFSVSADSDFGRFVGDGLSGTTTEDLEIQDFILNDDVYSLLPSNVSEHIFGGIDEVKRGQMFKQVVLHYKRGDRWVYFSYLNNNSYWVINEFKANFIELIKARKFYSSLSWEGEMDETKIHFEFIPEINTRYKNYTDQNNYNGEILVNSTQLLTNTQRLLNNCFGLALKFGIPNKAVAFEFQKFKDRIKKGDYIVDSKNNYWVANIINNEVVKSNGITSSKVELVKNYNKLSQFIKINQEKRYFQIDDKLIIESERNYTIFMYCWCNIDDSYFGTYTTLPSETHYIDRTIYETTNEFDKKIMGNGQININGAYLSSNIEGKDIFVPFKKYSGGNSLVFSCGFNEPVVAYRRTKYVKLVDGVKTFYAEGIYYSNKGNGAIKDAKITFYNTANLNDMPYPTSITKGGLKLENLNKTANEILRCNLQITFLSIVPNRIIFGRDLIEENPSVVNDRTTLGTGASGLVRIYVSSTERVFQRYRTLLASGWLSPFEYVGEYVYSTLFKTENNLNYIELSGWEIGKFIKSVVVVNDAYDYLVMGVNVNKSVNSVKIYFKSTNFHL